MKTFSIVNTFLLFAICASCETEFCKSELAKCGQRCDGFRIHFNCQDDNGSRSVACSCGEEVNPSGGRGSSASSSGGTFSSGNGQGSASASAYSSSNGGRSRSSSAQAHSGDAGSSADIDAILKQMDAMQTDLLKHGGGIGLGFKHT